MYNKRYPGLNISLKLYMTVDLLENLDHPDQADQEAKMELQAQVDNPDPLDQLDLLANLDHQV